MNRPITSTEIETIIKNLQTKVGARWLHRQITSKVQGRANIYPALTVSKIAEGGKLSN